MERSSDHERQLDASSSTFEKTKPENEQAHDSRARETMTFSHDDYTVAIICALPVEMAAAQMMLDSIHPSLPIGESDHNSYVLGQIESHKVVIACLPAGVYGTTSATTVANQLVSTFRRIRFGLMVGIGGGAPSNDNDIRLGDVVVSRPTATYGGVVQYDYGKTVVSGRFERTGSLNKPPQILLAAVSRLQAERLMYHSPLIDFSKFESKFRAFPFPGREQDRLFRSDYVHTPRLGTCESCDTKFLSSRIPRATKDPVIHYGLIASGNHVIKDAKTRDKLSREYGILCFDMEAAGLMDFFPCLVIRGVCDYSDSHKNKQWQPYAALTAAAYAKDLLLMVPGLHVEDSLLPTTTTSSNAELVYRVSHWLTPANFPAIQNDVISNRQEGTGQWLLDSTEYKAWRGAARPTLFCPGIPGAGKTMMSSIVIDDLQQHLENEHQVGMAYIFCNFKRQSEQSPTDLFAGLLKQLVENQPVLPDVLETLYEHHSRRKTRPTFHELSRILSQVMSHFGRVYLIIDALDECAMGDSSRDRMLREIFRMQKQGPISLFATSRFNPEIQHLFRGELSLEIRASKDDIAKFLAEHLSELPTCVQDDVTLQKSIMSEVIRASEGMFLLARLHIQSLYDKTTRRSVRQALGNLPSGLDQLDSAYEAVMQRITTQKQGFRMLAQRVLGWITCANRVLKTEELKHALAVEPGDLEIDEENFTPIIDMVSVCAGLVTINKESDVICLVHYTAQDYFQRTQQQWFPEAEAEMAKVCIGYLSFSTFVTGHCYTDEDFESRLKANPLFLYAARHWGHHCRTSSSDLDETVVDFLENEAKISSSTQAMTIYNKNPGYSQNMPQHVTGVHLSAYFGLIKVLETLLDNGNYPDLQDSHGRTPLSWAAESGQESSVKLLLALDIVECTSRDKSGETPASWAAKMGHVEVVTMLVNAGASMENSNVEGQSPLLLAARNGHVAVVQYLMQNKVDINSRDQSKMTPLAWAAASGQVTTLDLLLQQADIDLECKQHSGQTPLSLAAAEGHAAVVKKLLAVLADPASTDDQKRTPLSWAAEKGHDAAVTLLLHNSCGRQDTPDKYGRTPLSFAAANGRDIVVGLLMNSDGVNPNARSKDGRTPLCYAAMHGHTAVTRMLLTKQGIDPDPQDGCGRTPLSWAAKNGHEEVIEALVTTKRVNASLKDKSGRTPLAWADKHGHQSVVRLLRRKN